MNENDKRVQGMQLLAAGVAAGEVARRTGVTQMTVCRWRDRKSPKRAPRSKTTSGRPPLSTDDIEWLGDVLNKKKPRQSEWGVYTMNEDFILTNVQGLVRYKFPDSHEAMLSATGLQSWLKRNGFCFHLRHWMTQDERTRRQEQWAAYIAARDRDE